MIYFLLVLFLLSTNIVFAADPEAQILQVPVFRYLDSNGRPLAGGTVEFYETGTLNAKVIYTDAGRVASASSVTLDARGETVIYGYGEYRVRVKDRNGITIRTVDDVLIRTPSALMISLEANTTVNDMTAALGLGAAASLNIGTSDQNVVQYDGNNTLPAVNGNQLTNVGISNATALPRGYISGMVLSPDTAAPDTTLVISAGSTRDASDTDNLTLSSNFSKDLSVGWSSGSGGGAMMSGVTFSASTWYYVMAIGSTVASMSTDILVSDSTNTLTFPSGYSKYRRIGCIRSATGAGSGSMLGFKQVGDTFYWNYPKMGVWTAGKTTRNINSASWAYKINYVPDGLNHVTGMLSALLFSAGGEYPRGRLFSFWETDSFLSPSGISLAENLNALNASQEGILYPWNIFGWQERWIMNHLQIPIDGGAYIYGTATDEDGDESGMGVNIWVNGWTDRRGKDD